MHGEVQGCALAGHQGRRRTSQLQHSITIRYGGTITNQQLNLNIRIKPLEKALHQRSPAETTLLLDDPMGLPLTVLQCRSSQVAAAEVFMKPTIQGMAKYWILPVHTG